MLATSAHEVPFHFLICDYSAVKLPLMCQGFKVVKHFWPSHHGQLTSLKHWSSVQDISIGYIPSKRDIRLIISHREGQCFCEASEVPQVKGCSRAHIPLGRDISYLYHV